MITGKLTPRTNDPVCSCRFSGPFGQPDGFESVLTATVKRDGGLCLSLTYKMAPFPSVGSAKELSWAIELTSEQRMHLATLIGGYKPCLWEVTTEEEPATYAFEDPPPTA